jgi:RNA polymerase sigma-70 factor (ECF subfamily)
MAEDTPFVDLIRRIRAGEAPAAAELVRRYEPVVRMEVRCRMRDPRLRQQVDSMDICQSVLASFFVRAAAGQYDLDQPENLIRLLVVMARRKVAFQARRQRAQRRDVRRVAALHEEAGNLPTSDPSPSELVAGQELLDEFRRRLSPEERQLAELRAQGREWAQIAAEVGGSPQARRKQLERAVERVAQELGLDEAAAGEPLQEP